MIDTLPDVVRTRASDLRERARQQPLELIVFGAAFLIVASTFRPDSPHGWGNVEQWLNLTNAMFYGHQDFLFSYGPLFWLQGEATTPYSPLTYWCAVVFVSVTNAAFWALLVSLCHRARAYLYLAFAFFLFFTQVQQRDVLLLLPVALVAFVEFSGRAERMLTPRVLLATGLLVGADFYVRFMYGTVALAAFTGYLAFRALTRRTLRELLPLGIGTLAGYLVAGLLIFNDPASMVTYLRVNSQLSLGNSTDMQLDVPSTRASYVAVGVIVLVLNAYLLLRRRSLLLAVDALLLLLVKAGFGRSDHYLRYFVVPVALLALLMVFDRSRLGRLSFVVASVALFVLAATGTYPTGPTINAVKAVTDFSQPYAARMQTVDASFALDPATLARIGRASIDVYPYINEYAFANRLNYKHRPLFQNYMTLTPTLDAMNRDFFSSKGRPRFVLWTPGLNACPPGPCNPLNDFDGKYTLNEDPLTTSAILLNYHVAGHAKSAAGTDLLLLEENAGYTRYTASTIARTTMRFGQWYPVPQAAGGVVKIRPDFRPTLYGRLRTTFFRGGIVRVRYRLVGGGVAEYRLNNLNAASGVLASPLLDDLDLTGSRVEAVEFLNLTPGSLESAFRATWLDVPITIVRTRGS